MGLRASDAPPERMENCVTHHCRIPDEEGPQRPALRLARHALSGDLTDSRRNAWIVCNTLHI